MSFLRARNEEGLERGCGRARAQSRGTAEPIRARWTNTRAPIERGAIVARDAEAVPEHHAGRGRGLEVPALGGAAERVGGLGGGALDAALAVEEEQAQEVLRIRVAVARRALHRRGLWPNMRNYASDANNEASCSQRFLNTDATSPYQANGTK